MTMAANFAKMLGHIEKATSELQAAIVEFPMNDRLTLAPAYMLGGLRAVLAGCETLLEFAKQAQGKAAKPQPDPKATKS